MINKKEYMKKWRLSHKEHIKEYDAIHVIERQEACRKYDRTHREKRQEYLRTHKEQKKKTASIYRETHKEQLIEKQRKYRELNKEKIKLSSAEYRRTHQKQIKAHMKIYRHENMPKICAATTKKRREDINYRLLGNLRHRISEALKGNTKSKATRKLLGCSVEKFKGHLELQFTLGMSFSNYGKWHIDHIKPCASFDLTKESEQKQCFHYTNLQPLWAEDNLAKSDKF